MDKTGHEWSLLFLIVCDSADMLILSGRNGEERVNALLCFLCLHFLTIFYCFLLSFTCVYGIRLIGLYLSKGVGRSVRTRSFLFVWLRTETYRCVQGDGIIGCKCRKRKRRSGKTVSRQSSLFIPGRRSGKRKNTKTLNTRTLYGMGNAWNGGKAILRGFRLRFGCGRSSVFAVVSGRRCPWGGDLAC